MKRLLFFMLIACILLTTVNCNCRINISIKDTTEETAEVIEPTGTSNDEEAAPQNEETDENESEQSLLEEDSEVIIVIPEDEDTFGE